MDYAFLGGELNDLIGEWLEEERLNAPDVMPPSMHFGPSTRNATETEIVSAETFEHPSVAEMDEMTATPDPSIASKDFAREPSLKVAAIQPLINLEEEPKATVNPTVVCVSSL